MSISRRLLSHTHVFGRSSLQIHSAVEQFVENGRNSILLIQRRQASEESEQQLELSPVAGVQSLLAQWTGATQDILRNICLLIVGVQHSASHEWDLEWLLDDPNNSSVSFVLMLPQHSNELTAS